MKFSIDTKTLAECLKRGGMAALSDDAQNDSTVLSALIKSIKITVDSDNICFESATSLSASKYVVKVDGKIVVKEHGQIVVSCRDLNEWVGKQGDCVIGFRLNSFSSPQAIGSSDKSSNDGDVAVNQSAIYKVGSVEIISRDENKTGARWSLDSYSTENLPDFDELFNPDRKAAFEIPCETLASSISTIESCCLSADYDHIKDSIVFQHDGTDFYAMATDMSRIGICKIPGVSSISMKKAFTESEYQDQTKDTKAWEQILLVPTKFLKSAIKLFAKEETVTFYYNDEKNKVFICQPNLTFRFNTADKDSLSKPPPLYMITSKNASPFCKVNKDVLSMRLNAVAIVNKNAVLFDFVKITDKNGNSSDELRLLGMSEMGKSPSKANMQVGSTDRNAIMVLNVKHVFDVIKSSSGDSLEFCIVSEDPNIRSIQINDSSNPNVEYYLMTVTQSKYDLTQNVQ